MVIAAPQPVGRPWAFWSPASDEQIEEALDLAALGSGERFLDVGCGDGRVLVAAARRGALVRGIEMDPRIAASARANLAAAGVSGEVDEGDAFSADLHADVLYAYLTPVLLSELAPRLALLPAGTRVVTPRYRIVDWAQSAAGASCFRYDLPALPAASPASAGWDARAILVVVPPMRRCLLSLTFAAEAGDVELSLSSSLRRALKVRLGAARAPAPRPVAVDFQVQPHRSGAVAGEVRVQGHDLAVAVVYSDSGQGQWRFDAGQGEAYRHALAAARERARAGGQP